MTPLPKVSGDDEMVAFLQALIDCLKDRTPLVPPPGMELEIIPGIGFRYIAKKQPPQGGSPTGDARYS
jgi:hypothetical protein